jgi:uncharacterized membrane protein
LDKSFARVLLLLNDKDLWAIFYFGTLILKLIGLKFAGKWVASETKAIFGIPG